MTTVVIKPGQAGGNPFARTAPAHINAGTVRIEEERAIAEAQGKLILAKKFPRDQATSYGNVMESCKRYGLADAATYSYPRGKETISGPSIRLAEELARNWGNIEYGIRELSQQDGISEMEAYCWDLEANVISSQKFTVKHERHTKSGIFKLTDPRDIYEITANSGGRRLRARILAVLPPDLIEDAIKVCQLTLRGGNGESIADRTNKMVTLFEAYGVNKKMIEDRLQKTVDKITAEEIVELGSVYNSIKDNMSSVLDWFTVQDEEKDKFKTLTEQAKAEAPVAAVTPVQPDKPTAKKEAPKAPSLPKKTNEEKPKATTEVQDKARALVESLPDTEEKETVVEEKVAANKPEPEAKSEPTAAAAPVDLSEEI